MIENLKDLKDIFESAKQ